MVVLLNSSVQLMATESTSGVLADEKRRVAAPRFAEARNPPTGASAASGGPTSLAPTRAAIGPRKPTASTSMIAVISDVAAAVSGAWLVVDDQEQRDCAGEREQPADEAAGAEQARLDRGVGERDRRPHAGGASPGGQDGEQRDRDSADDRRRTRASSRPRR